jgi:hypothetical protein
MNTCRAASWLCVAQRIRMLLTVEVPSGTTWSNSRRVVDPQKPPTRPATGSTRHRVSRRLASPRQGCAAGWRRGAPARAGASSRSLSSCRSPRGGGRGRPPAPPRCRPRRRSAVSGLTSSGLASGRGASGGGHGALAGTSPRSSSRRTAAPGGAWSVGASSRVTALAGAAGCRTVTTSRCGAASAGRSSAATALAARFDAWKKRATTSPRFSGVMTFASSTTLVMQSLPCRRGSMTSG